MSHSLIMRLISQHVHNPRFILGCSNNLSVTPTVMLAKELPGALVDPMVHSQLAAPRAAVRQAALESLSELDLSVLVQHGPAIAARLEDRQMAVRRAALHALKRLPAASLFDYLPAILERLEDNDDEVRDSAQELLELLDSASGLPPSSALQMRRLEDCDSSVRGVAIQALREGAALERLAPVLVRNLKRPRWVVRQGALEALAALSPLALASHMHEVAGCMVDTHTAVRLSALQTLGVLDPIDLVEVAPRASPLINEANPLIVASALDLLTRLAPEDLAPYADQISCCRFDEAADVRAAAQRALAKLRGSRLGQATRGQDSSAARRAPEAELGADAVAMEAGAT